MTLRSLSVLIWHTAAATLLLNASLSATADTRIRGEFEYNVDESALSEWKIGPVFSLSESSDTALELEIPIGQDDEEWLVEPELTYEVEVDDIKFEFNVGIEAPFNGDPVQGSAGVEGSIDF